jgi:hypothetical protein
MMAFAVNVDRLDEGLVSTKGCIHMAVRERNQLGLVFCEVCYKFKTSYGS